MELRTNPLRCQTTCNQNPNLGIEKEVSGPSVGLLPQSDSITEKLLGSLGLRNSIVLTLSKLRVVTMKV